jgi:hypothetical protein
MRLFSWTISFSLFFRLLKQVFRWLYFLKNNYYLLSPSLLRVSAAAHPRPSDLALLLKMRSSKPFFEGCLDCRVWLAVCWGRWRSMVFLRGGRSLGTALQESGFREADRLDFVMGHAMFLVDMLLMMGCRVCLRCLAIIFIIKIIVKINPCPPATD